VSFGHPYLLLMLLVVPLAVAAYRFVERRRMRYTVRYTNVEVLTLVAGGRPWRRYATAAVFLASVALLCVAVSQPHVRSTVTTPPTRDHQLVGEAVDAAGDFRGFGGTAIGDAIAVAVRLGLATVGSDKGRTLASYSAAPPHVASSLVSILFLSDGHQTQGYLQPLQGAARARAAGIPIYTIALGTTGATTLRGFPNGFNGAAPFGVPGLGARGLSPDPVTLKAIATATGGQFFRARSAGAADAAYRKLGSSLGRTTGTTEVTNAFIAAAAALLVLAGVLSALWAPRLP